MAYTRRPEHWQADTSGRHGFEKEVREALTSDGAFEILDSTDSFDEVDFELGCRGKRLFLEVKEKKQRYREAWQQAAGRPESDLFILDELAARKILLRAPRGYLLICDRITNRLVVWGALELACVPKVRVNRSINGGMAMFKGKWLLDLRHGEAAATIGDALAYVRRRSSSEDELWGALACHGRFDGELVPRL